MNPRRRVTLGRVSGLFGVDGRIKVYSYTRPPANIFGIDRWFIGGGGRQRLYSLREGHEHGKALIARLTDVERDQPVDDRDTAVPLVGQDIAVAREAMPVLPAGEHYWFDLVGMTVVDLNGRSLGVVRHMLETGGAHDVLVAFDGERERLIPFVMDDIIARVDYANARIETDWDPDF